MGGTSINNEWVIGAATTNEGIVALLSWGGRTKKKKKHLWKCFQCTGKGIGRKDCKDGKGRVKSEGEINLHPILIIGGAGCREVVKMGNELQERRRWTNCLSECEGTSVEWKKHGKTAVQHRFHCAKQSRS